MTASPTGFPYTEADWPAPPSIVAFTTCHGGRDGSVAGTDNNDNDDSTESIDSTDNTYGRFNFALHVGDDAAKVDQHRQQLVAGSPGLEQVQWLQQVHGTHVVDAGDAVLPSADACFSVTMGLACAVLTADCLPLLLCDRNGDQVAAVHAGWRGLLGGVIEQTLRCFSARPQELLVWLGPAISVAHYEVGEEMRNAFLSQRGDVSYEAISAAFLDGDQRDGKKHYFADLYQLARLRLAAQSVTEVYGGDDCTYRDKERFYSFRRDGVTGRMASVIYRRS